MSLDYLYFSKVNIPYRENYLNRRLLELINDFANILLLNK